MSVNEYELLAEKFTDIFNMNKNNDYMSTIFDVKKVELEGYLKRYYPEYLKEFNNAVDKYREAYAKLIGVNKELPDDSKKKQITAQMM